MNRLALRPRTAGSEDRAAPADFPYWLCRCEGFAVYGADGRLGTVLHLRFDSEVHRPEALVVRTGLLVRRTFTVQCGDVAKIEPSSRRLTLGGVPTGASRGYQRTGDRPNRSTPTPPPGEME
jgi:hypothetical protein